MMIIKFKGNKWVKPVIVSAVARDRWGRFNPIGALIIGSVKDDGAMDVYVASARKPVDSRHGRFLRSSIREIKR